MYLFVLACMCIHCSVILIISVTCSHIIYGSVPICISVKVIHLRLQQKHELR